MVQPQFCWQRACECSLIFKKNAITISKDCYYLFSINGQGKDYYEWTPIIVCSCIFSILFPSWPIFHPITIMAKVRIIINGWTPIIIYSYIFYIMAKVMIIIGMTCLTDNRHVLEWHVSDNTCTGSHVSQIISMFWNVMFHR